MCVCDLAEEFPFSLSTREVILCSRQADGPGSKSGHLQYTHTHTHALTHTCTHTCAYTPTERATPVPEVGRSRGTPGVQRYGAAKATIDQAAPVITGNSSLHYISTKQKHSTRISKGWKGRGLDWHRERDGKDG